MKAVCITGSPRAGLAGALYKIYPDATFISRSSSGVDLTSAEGQVYCARTAALHEVFINCAALWKFSQTVLLEAVQKAAVDKNPGLHIVNVGSTTDRVKNGRAWLYNAEKKALRDYSNTLSIRGVWESGPKVSYVSFGTLSNNQHKHPDRRVMSLEDAAQYIKWVIDQPSQFNVNEISIDPMQGIEWNE
jgi:short-subunit dehydrogenase